MRLFMCLLVISFVANFGSAPAIGQNQNPEFIESSSPLPSGGRVASRSTSAGGLQTVTFDSQSSTGDIENGLSSVWDQETTSNANRESVFKQSSSTDYRGIGQGFSNQRYPYPAPNQNQIVRHVARSQAGLIHPAVRATRTCNDCQVPFQLPTLGLSNTNTTRTARHAYGQSNCCTPQTYAPNTALAVPAFQTPVLQIQPPASQIPTLAIQDPNQVSQLGSGAFQTTPNFGAQQFGTQQFGTQRSSWWDPIISGSGVYQPIVRFANVRPGTNLGQGIIGQPTAYVDGQPIRNLLRFVSP